MGHPGALCVRFTTPAGCFTSPPALSSHARARPRVRTRALGSLVSCFSFGCCCLVFDSARRDGRLFTQHRWLNPFYGASKTVCDLHKHRVNIVITASKTRPDLRKHRVLTVYGRRYGHPKTHFDLRVCVRLLWGVLFSLSARETEQTAWRICRGFKPDSPARALIRTAQHN